MTTSTRLDELLATARALLRLAQEQRASIEADAHDRFDNLLEERMTLLERLGVNDAGGASSLAASFAGAPAALRAEVLAAFADLALVDAENEAELALERRSILDALPAIEVGRRAAAAYHSSVPAAYVDTAS